MGTLVLVSPAELDRLALAVGSVDVVVPALPRVSVTGFEPAAD